MTDREPLLTDKGVSAMTGIPEGTLRNYRYLGTGPAYVKIGGHVRYKPCDVDAWIDGHTVTPGAA